MSGGLLPATVEALKTAKVAPAMFSNGGEAEAWDNQHRVGPIRVLPQVGWKAYVLLDTRLGKGVLPATYPTSDEAMVAAKAILEAEAPRAPPR